MNYEPHRIIRARKSAGTIASTETRYLYSEATKIAMAMAVQHG
jgi:hypothetical protein